MHPSERLRAALLAALLVSLNAAWIAAALGPLHRSGRVRETDHFRYIRMAEAPPGLSDDSGARARPFCFRVLVPALVHVLVRAGVPLHAAFYGLTVVSLWLFLFTLWAYLRESGLMPWPALLGLLLAGLTPGAVRWYAYQYWMPDPLCLWLVVLALRLARARHLSGLAVVSVAGVMTRETFLIAIPWALLLWWREEGRSVALRRAAGVFAAPLASLAALHFVIAPVGGPSLTDAALEMLPFRWRHLFDNQLYFMTLGTWGAFAPLLLARAERPWHWLRTRPEDAVLVSIAYLSLAFANNTDRLLVYALPALLPPALRTLERVRPPRAPLVAATLLGQAWFWFRTPAYGMAGLSIYQPVQWSVVLGMAALLVALRLRLGGSAYSSS